MPDANYRLTNMERETIVTTRDAGERSTTLRVAKDEKEWHVFSEIPAHIRRFTKYWGPGKDIGRHGGKIWLVPLGSLRIAKKRSVAKGSDTSHMRKALTAKRSAHA